MFGRGKREGGLQLAGVEARISDDQSREQIVRERVDGLKKKTQNWEGKGVENERA